MKSFLKKLYYTVSPTGRRIRRLEQKIDCDVQLHSSVCKLINDLNKELYDTHQKMQEQIDSTNNGTYKIIAEIFEKINTISNVSSNLLKLQQNNVIVYNEYLSRESNDLKSFFSTNLSIMLYRLEANVKIDTAEDREILHILKTYNEKIHPYLEKIYYRQTRNFLDYCWKDPQKIFPYSCTEEEAIILYKVIKYYQLKSGFEVATAFGYSTLWEGLAFKNNHGAIVTIDCYVEETKEAMKYTPAEVRLIASENKKRASQGILPDGLQKAHFFASQLDLEDTICFNIGVSPEDVDSILPDAIDYAFIDGGHFGDQPTIDFKAISDRLSNKAIIFFHDNNETFGPVSNAVKEAEKLFGNTSIQFNTRCNLTIVFRGIDSQYLEYLQKKISMSSYLVI